MIENLKFTVYVCFRTALETKTTCKMAWDMQYLKHVAYYRTVSAY